MGPVVGYNEIHLPNDPDKWVNYHSSDRRTRSMQCFPIAGSLAGCISAALIGAVEIHPANEPAMGEHFVERVRRIA